MPRIPALLFLPFALLFTGPSVHAAEIERIDLHQREAVQIQHQRRVGNLRAQAQRQGWIVRVPQLFVYLSDRSPVFHMDGLRSRFERQLDWAVERSRIERTTIDLDRLLANTETHDGGIYGLENLPEGDLYIVLYRGEDCADCDAVDATVVEWLEGLGEVDVVWLDIAMDRVR